MSLYEDNGFSWKRASIKQIKKYLPNLNLDNNLNYAVFLNSKKPSYICSYTNKLINQYSLNKDINFFIYPFLIKLINAEKLTFSKLMFPVKTKNNIIYPNYEYLTKTNNIHHLSISSSLVKDSIYGFAWELHFWPTLDIMRHVVASRSKKFPNGAISVYEAFSEKTDNVVLGAFNFVKNYSKIETIVHEVIHAIYHFNRLKKYKEEVVASTFGNLGSFLFKVLKMDNKYSSLYVKRNVKISYEYQK